eukprot:CAMPEP_0118852068 /NCGR_PEP_ID=MMETSP1163-20130328/1244_1 /TAXON_ID=124430 /ORGANISM="Phaeomonas parva, Strain CCMP2877" /LENGTH=94 /DNA_ID=CAMNT_0006784469 /DNA_START=316 /DNA_END=596 /DNA_ORIENTATION=+
MRVRVGDGLGAVPVASAAAAAWARVRRPDGEVQLHRGSLDALQGGVQPNRVLAAAPDGRRLRSCGGVSVLYRRVHVLSKEGLGCSGHGDDVVLG